MISRKVIEDDGNRQLVEVDQAAVWRFLWFSGTLNVCVLVDQDRRNRMVRQLVVGTSGDEERDSLIGYMVCL